MDVSTFLRQTQKAIKYNDHKETSLFYRYLDFIKENGLSIEKVHLRAIAALLNYNPLWADKKYEELANKK